MIENLLPEAKSKSARAATGLLGRVFDIQRFSIHDGPGIRTTVFLKGCPLRCLWCHNPEGMSASQAISFQPEKCIACGECVRVCAHGAHRLEAAEAQGAAVIHAYDRQVCEACGKCTETCDTQSLEFVGRLMTVDDVIEEALRDRTFYATSGGGMTISGGEPLAQIAFTVALLQAAREEGLHRCVETAGFASWERLRLLLPLVDIFLFDFKETDAQRHAEYTGQSNHLILENLRALDAAGARIQLQCPLVPGMNDREDHFAGIAALARSLRSLEGVRLLPYHPLGDSKLHRFGLSPAPNLSHQPLDPAQLEHWSQWLCQKGVRVLNTYGSPSSEPKAETQQPKTRSESPLQTKL